MGISDGLQGSAAEVDCSAGTIVWVRRRNGSWWPGKILGSDELSASHLMSPRSGTPVKLLGREDASVDWYNLEKSKRVKAFRCGEFDDCIDKAEKSQGVPIKKREKYARREDAILHALEIERQQLEKKHKKLVNANSASSKKAKVLKKELDSSSEHLDNSGSKFVSLRPQPLTKGLDSAEENTSNPSFSQRGNHGKQSSWEDDKSEAIPRMRGLQDFGLRIAPKRKNPPVVSEGTRRHRPDNHVHDLPSGSRSLGSAGPVTSSKDLLDIKRKRTQGGLLEESLVKRRDRRRPLVQVLQSSAKLSANHTLPSGEDISPSMQEDNEQGGVICRAKRSRYVYLPSDPNATECPDEMQVSPSHYERDSFHLTPGSLAEEKTTSGLMEKAESDSSRSDPDMDEEQTVLSDTILTQPMAGPENGCIQEPTESTTDDELEEAVAVNDYMSPRHSYDQTSAATDTGVSKWQLKGKRNSRNVVKRPIIKSLKRSSAPMDGTYLEGKGYNSNSMALAEQSRYQASEGLDYDYDGDEVIEKKSLHNQMLDFGSRRYPSMPKGVSKNSHRTNVGNVGSGEDSVWEADGLSQAAFRGYWDESVECYDPLYSGSRLGGGKESMLVDVDLKVQASYQGEHVPLVSLMSRLNGKAIIGHPVQIEVLEDGFSDVFLSTNEDLSEELIDNDGSTALRPVWRTARRTNMHRVPRPHPSTSLNADEAGDQLQFLVPESRPPYNKLNTVTPSQIARKSSDVCASAGKKISKKPTRKASLTSQKTRTLSSFAMEQKLNGKGGSNKINRSGLDGLIKPENGPTTVTCIPLKLVFSRLLEAVGRPPSRPMNHIMSIDGDKERKQLPGSM